MSVDQAALKINRENRICRAIEHDRHLEQEDLVGTVHLPRDRVVIRIQKVAVIEEAARETTKDQDLITVFLNNAAALTLWQHLVVQVDQLPGASRLVVVSLNRVDVLASLVGNATEDVDPAVAHGTRCVVVSADIHVWHLKPEIDISIVHFALHVRVVFLLA